MTDIKKLLSLAGEFEKMSMGKNASANAFYVILRNEYDNMTDALNDYINAMNKCADNFAAEQGGEDSLGEEDKKILEVMYKQASLLEKVLPEMHALSEEING